MVGIVTKGDVKKLEDGVSLVRDLTLWPFIIVSVLMLVAGVKMLIF